MKTILQEFAAHHAVYLEIMGIVAIVLSYEIAREIRATIREYRQYVRQLKLWKLDDNNSPRAF